MNIKQKITTFFFDKFKEKKRNVAVNTNALLQTDEERLQIEIEKKNKISERNAFIEKIKLLAKDEHFNFFVENILIEKLRKNQIDLINAPAEKLLHFQGKLADINEILTDINNIINTNYKVYEKPEETKSVNDKIEKQFEQSAIDFYNDNFKDKKDKI